MGSRREKAQKHRFVVRQLAMPRWSELAWLAGRLREMLAEHGSVLFSVQRKLLESSAKLVVSVC